MSASLRFRMVYMTTTASRPHTLPLIAESAEAAARQAETLCALPGWTLLTVKSESLTVDRSPLARMKAIKEKP